LKSIILTAAIATSIMPALADPYHTVDWYMAHPTERADTLAQCQNNVGLWGQHPNCTNAGDAKSRADWIALSRALPAFNTFDQSEINACRWAIRAHVQLPPNQQALCAKALGGK
jgi:hypothetical protein